MTTAKIAATVEGDGREVTVSTPDKAHFSARGETKLDLVHDALAVGDGAQRGVYERPCVMKRYREGAEGEFSYQKRVPAGRPEWLSTCVVSFPSGRTAEELCPTDVAHVVWGVNLGCLDLNPWHCRRSDLDHPDELRVDLGPQPGVPFAAEPRWGLLDVRRAALALARGLGDAPWPRPDRVQPSRARKRRRA